MSRPSNSSRKIRRRLVVSAVVVSGGVLVARSARRRVAQMQPAVDRVAPELRNPILYLRLRVDDRRLPRHRQLLQLARLSPNETDVEERVVPKGTDGAEGPRVLLYEATDRSRPSGALLWIHGGGMVMGVPEQDHQWCSRLADELGILVVNVDYRLAPEQPFPAGLDDCMAALQWMHDNAEDLRIEPDRIAVAGASAGGGLAASVCQRARDEGGPRVCFQLLNYPMLDDRTVLADDHEGRGELIWTPDSNRYGWTAYLGSAPAADDDRPHAAPGRTADLSDLPPAWIGVGDLDLFYAEDVDYARRLEADGVPCELYTEEGMYHGADQLAAAAPSMQAYQTAMVDALRLALS